MNHSPSLGGKGRENILFGEAGSGSGKGKESEYTCKARIREKKKKTVRTVTPS
jgi:hypothetical protein